MRRQAGEQVKIVALFGTMTAVSGLAAFFGEPIGWFGVLFFGGGGAMMLYLERAGSRPDQSGGARVRHGSLAGAGRYTRETDGVVITGKRGYLVAATLGSVVFVVMGVGMMLYGSVFFGALAVVVFGAFLVIGLRGLLTPHQGIALLPEGVFFRTPAGHSWMRWEAIDKVWVGQSRGQPFLAFRAEPIEQAGLHVWLRRLNRRWFQMDAGFSAGLSHNRLVDIGTTVRECVADPARRPRLADPDEPTPGE